MLIKKIHHVAYRCINAKQTALWYEKHLGIKFVLAIAEDEVPSTKAPDPDHASMGRAPNLFTAA